MSQPPLPGQPHPPSATPENQSARVVSTVVMGSFAAMGLVAGVGILLCGGLGMVMTGTTDTGAGAMMVVGLVIIVISFLLLAGALLPWRND